MYTPPTKLIALIACLWQASVGAEAIATAHPLATQVGAQILENGGNAFDAAVAISAVLGVVEPYSSGIGGGGFYLLYEAHSSRWVMVDARERAPLKATPDMYLDKSGEVVKGASINGALSAGIPGIPAALDHIAQHYGKQTLATLLAPAIDLAQQGFPVDHIYQEMVKLRYEVISRYRASRQTFLIDNQIPEIGALIKQTNLAKTLKRIAKQGADGFYQGKVARELVRAVRANKGIWVRDDLADYRIVERPPIKVAVADGHIYSAPPPSSGGVALAQIFGQLTALNLLNADQKLAQHHGLIEAMRRAYRDRAVYLGDSDYIDLPLARLIDPDYAAGLAASIHPKKASQSHWWVAQPPAQKAHHTTHFSVYDRFGNMVSATLSINYPFGSGMIAGNTGVLLNDEMDDFVAKPGVANVYGLVGGRANAIAPGKRMLSSMSPSVLQLPHRTVILGTPGGSRIISMVAQGLLTALAGGSAEEIVNRPRLHHQFVPDLVYLEPDALTAKQRQQLIDMGHRIEPAKRSWGNMQAIVIEQDGQVSAVSDRRGIGQVWVNDPPAKE